MNEIKCLSDNLGNTVQVQGLYI